jgi:hypothetical protein
MGRSKRKTAGKKGRKRRLSLYLLVSLGVIGSLALFLFLLPKSAEKKVVQPIPRPQPGGQVAGGAQEEKELPRRSPPGPDH